VFLLHLGTVVEVVDELHGELLIGDWAVDISDPLQFAAIGHNGHVFLDRVPKFLCEVDVMTLRVLGED
jgi:hypothetical protein